MTDGGNANYRIEVVEAGENGFKAKAEESIERDKQRAVNEIKDEISDIVIMAASKVVEKEISAKDNEAIIAGFLDSVGTAK